MSSKAVCNWQKGEYLNRPDYQIFIQYLFAKECQPGFKYMQHIPTTIILVSHDRKARFTLPVDEWGYRKSKIVIYLQLDTFLCFYT